MAKVVPGFTRPQANITAYAAQLQATLICWNMEKRCASDPCQAIFQHNVDQLNHRHSFNIYLLTNLHDPRVAFHVQWKATARQVGEIIIKHFMCGAALELHIVQNDSMSLHVVTAVHFNQDHPC